MIVVAAFGFSRFATSRKKMMIKPTLILFHSWQEIATACKLVSSSDVQRRFMGTQTRRQGESGDAHGYAGRIMPSSPSFGLVCLNMALHLPRTSKESTLGTGYWYTMLSGRRWLFQRTSYAWL